MDDMKLKYFISAAKSLNFSEVARVYYISQPTISHQIDMLEGELGVKLFHRNGKRLALTGEGANFLPTAMKLVESMESAKNDLRHYSMGMEGEIRILLSETGTSIYKECLKLFGKRYPNIGISTHYAQSASQMDAIIKGTNDIYFVFEDLVKANGDYEYVVASPDCLCLVLPRDIPAPEDIYDFSSLENVPYIGLNTMLSTYLVKDIKEIMERRNFTPREIHLHNKLEEMLILVEVGIGFAISPCSIVEISGKNVNSIPLPDVAGRANRVVAWRKSHYNRATDCFIEVVKELYQP